MRFSVTVTTSHHERLPSPEIVVVAIGSASCKVSLTLTTGGGSGSCSLSNPSALQPGTYTASVTYGGDADLVRSNTAKRTIVITST